VLPKDIAQAHLCVGGMGLPFHDKRKYALFVLNAVLGGGMTSRLFQKIREEAALAYSIYSDVDFCLDTGLLCISAGTDAADVPQVLDMIHQECEGLRHSLLSEEELKDAKSQLIGSLLLAQESTVNVMNRLARMEIYLDSYRPIDETVAAIEAVTSDKVRDIADELLSPDKLSVAVVGPIDPNSLPVSHE
jgi:predicted Zn-dependent peptidase